MKRLQYIGTYDIIVLRYQLLAQFPEWRYEQPPIFIDYFGMQYDIDSSTLTLDVPDNADEFIIEQILDAHDPSTRLYTPLDWQDVVNARNNFMNLPNWSTWTGQEAADYILTDILNGMSKIDIENWVEVNVTSLATAKTALKLIGGELVDLREICMKMAQSIMYLRDVAIRRRI